MPSTYPHACITFLIVDLYALFRGVSISGNGKASISARNIKHGPGPASPLSTPTTPVWPIFSNTCKGIMGKAAHVERIGGSGKGGTKLSGVFLVGTSVT